MNLIFFALIVHIVAIKGTPLPRVMGVVPGPDIFPRSHRLKTQPTSSSSATTIHACLDYTLMDYSHLDYRRSDYKAIWTTPNWTTYDVWTIAVWTTKTFGLFQLDYYLVHLDY